MKKIVALIAMVSVISFGLKLIGYEIRGLETVPEASLTFQLDPFVGEELTLDLINEMKRVLMETGYFKDVRADLEDAEGGMEIIFEVEENPVVEGWRIEVEGPGLVGKEELEKVVSIEKNVALNLKDVRKTIVEFKRIYEESGYFLVEFSGDMEDGVYVFKITEYAIWKAVVNGIESDKVKKLITIKEYEEYGKTPWILRVFKDRKSYYPKLSDVQATLYRLTNSVYVEKVTPRFEKVEIEGVDAELVDLILDITPRKVLEKPLRIEKIALENANLIDPSELELDANGTLTNTDVLDLAQEVLDAYEKRGYLMTWVIPRVEGTKLVLDVREKYITDIEYRNLMRTREYLLKDLITVRKGDPLRKDALSQTYANLNRSNYFDDVEIIPETRMESTSVKLIFDFTEKEKRFNFMGGIAWTPPKAGEWWMGFGGQLSLSTTNPFGYGQSASVSLNLGLETKRVDLKYSIPRPMDMPFSLSSSLGYSYTLESTETESTETHIVSLEGNVLTVPILSNTFGFGLGFEWKDVDGESGETLKVIVSHSLDTRDSSLNPKNGVRLSERFEKAGLFDLNNEDYLKLTTSLNVYHEMPFGIVFAVESFGGFVDLKKGDEAMKLSYANSIRGYGTLKGTTAFKVSFQIKYPFLEEGVPLNGIVFYDTGGVSDTLEFPTDFVWSAGIGVEIVAPIFGNLEVGLAYKSTTGSFDLYFLLGMVM